MIDKRNFKKNILDISIKQLLINWNTIMIQIINDITDLFSNNFKFKNKWWEDIINIFINIYKILIKEERSIYFGLTLIFISILLFTIKISS